MKLKKYITEKRLLWFFIGLIVVTTLADIISALTSPIFEIAEANPIYLLTGSVAPLLVINVIVVLWFARNLNRSISITKIFFFCMFTIYLSLGHGFGVWSNISATNDYEEHPQKYIDRIEQYDVKDKISAYLILVGFVMFLPIIISYIAFSVALFFYERRQSKRNRIVTKICKLTNELMKG